MELHASGFNAHHQLLPSPSPNSTPASNLLTFRPVLTTTNGPIKIRAALWSTTVIERQGQLWQHGHNGRDLAPVPILGMTADDTKCVFGDVSGVLGAVGKDGKLYVYRNGNGDGGKPRLSHWIWQEGTVLGKSDVQVQSVAIAESEEVCVCTSAEPGGEWALHTFRDFASLLEGDGPAATFALAHPLVDLQASGACTPYSMIQLQYMLS